MISFLGYKTLIERDVPWWIPPVEVDLQTGLLEIVEGETPVPVRAPGKWYNSFKEVLV